jgi:hypothetical protein
LRPEGRRSRPRAAAIGLALTAGVMALALMIGGRVPTLIFGGLATLFPALLLLLATRRASRGVRCSILGFGLWLLVSLICLIWLAENRPHTSIGGLPLATWVMLLAVGLVPLPWIVVTYLRAFDDE